MRWNLMNSFDEIYILDLHGNSKKKEKGVDGSKDENVFDIQQGVSINIFIKSGKKKENDLAKVFYYDLLGTRNMKYEYLLDSSFKNIPFKEILPNSPFYFFLPSNSNNIETYELGFSMADFFNIGVTGTVTGNDNQLIGANHAELKERLESIINSSIDSTLIKPIEYRPFDKKVMYFVETFIKNPYPQISVPDSYRSRYTVMKHLANSDNHCLIIGRQGQVVGDMPWNIIFISNNIVDLNMFYRGGGVVNPLYLYPDSTDQQSFAQGAVRTPNLNMQIVAQMAAQLELTFTPEKEAQPGTFAPIDILDYIYAVLHSPTYREKYKEFLKIDFPRVPYPSDVATFWQLVRLGGELRQIHLLESPSVERYITQYPESGSNQVTAIQFRATEQPDGDGAVGRVYINDTQYFDSVPQRAWEFFIGGYQPAQKWLKDRKGRTLDYTDILHYQKIIVALTETHKCMQAIDAIAIEAI